MSGTTTSTSANIAAVTKTKAVDNETALDATGRPLSAPTTEEIKAYLYCRVMGKKQADAADQLKTNQGTVSRWISKVEAFLKAGGNCPEILNGLNRLQTLDPSVIEFGKRRDGITKAARPKKSDD